MEDLMFSFTGVARGCGPFPFQLPFTWPQCNSAGRGKPPAQVCKMEVGSLEGVCFEDILSQTINNMTNTNKKKQRPLLKERSGQQTHVELFIGWTFKVFKNL